MNGLLNVSLQNTLCLAFILFGLSLPVRGQTSFDITVNQNPVRYGQDVQLTVRFKNFRQQIETPKISGLQFRSGPTTTQNNTWINGKSSSEISYTFTYTVAVQKDIAIPSMQIKGPQGVMNSQPFTLRVLSSKVPPNEIKKASSLGDLACVIELSKTDVFIGEPIIASFKIYNRSANLDVREYNVPEMPGFWKETLEQPDPGWEPQVIAGRRYNVANVKTVILFPQQTGKITLSGFELTGYLRTSFFDGKNVSAQANPVTVNVRPLPEPVPSNNIGAFRKLKVQTKISTNEAFANDAMSVDIVYTGEGNLKFIREPQLSWPSTFEVFDPEVNDNIKISKKGEKGSRTFRFVVIPRSPGTFQIPSIDNTWFNIRKRAFESLESSGPSINIKRNESVPESGMSYNSKTDVQVLSQDIRYIQTDWNGKCMQRSEWDGRNISAAGFLSIGPLMFGLAWFFRRRKEQIEGDALGYKKKRAKSKIQSELKSAKSLVNDKNAFFPALGKGMETYLLAKLGWNASQNQREKLQLALEKHAATSAQDWILLLEQIDLARFSPDNAAAPEQLLEAASKLVEQTEKTWKA